MAAGQVFEQLLAGGVVGRPTPIGNRRASNTGAKSLARKLGRRILPKDFQIFDDPTVVKHGKTWLMGHYRFDDEGVPAQRIRIVEGGMLRGMAMSRVPTKKLSGSNGHGRAAWSGGAPQATIGSLFISSSKAKTAAELKRNPAQGSTRLASRAQAAPSASRRARRSLRRAAPTPTRSARRGMERGGSGSNSQSTVRGPPGRPRMSL